MFVIKRLLINEQTQHYRFHVCNMELKLIKMIRYAKQFTINMKILLSKSYKIEFFVDIHIWGRVKIARRQNCTRGQNCTRTNLHEVTNLHERTKLHKDKFALRVNFARATNLHGESNLHGCQICTD